MKVNDNDSKAQEMTNSQAKRAERKKEAQQKKRQETMQNRYLKLN